MMKPRNAFMILVCWVLLIHLSSFVGGYTFDDMTVTESENFRDLGTWRWWSWTGRPVGRISFALQFATLGRSAIASHVVNIAVHLVAVAGLYRVVTLSVLHLDQNINASRARWCAFVAALLWGVHPITTTTVTYVIQRYESLAAAAMLWSFYFWLAAHTEGGSSLVRSNESPKRSPARSESLNRLAWLASIGCGLIAMASKECAAGLPLILLLGDRVLLRNRWSETLRHGWALIALLTPVIVGAAIRMPYLTKPNNRNGTIGFRLAGIDAWEYIATQPLVYLRYLKLLVWPSDMVLDYGWIPSQFDTWFVWGWIGWVCLIVGLIFAFRWNFVIGWSLLSCLLILATTSFVPTQDVIFEHRFYLPSAILISVLVTAVFLRIVRPAERGNEITPDALYRSKVGLAIVGVLATVLSSVTIMRNLDYVSTENLARVDLERQPDNPRNVCRVGAEAATNQIELETALRRSIELSEKRGYYYSGSDFKWRRDLGDLLLMRGELEQAKTIYSEALEVTHNDLQIAQALMPLAVIHSTQGQREKADELFTEALTLDTAIRPNIEEAFAIHRSRGKTAEKSAGGDPSGGIPAQTPPAETGS